LSECRCLGEALTMPMVKRFKGSDYGEIKKPPTSFVVDRKGILRYAGAGAFTLDSMKQVFEPLLAESAE
jgi:cytochrome c biogenesis protein CcmG/thiol:disulfide interchange protein DsbE